MPEDLELTDEGRFAVLDVFGVKLEVSNPRLAELLTMDAGEGLRTDVKTLGSETIREIRAETQQADPDVLLSAPTPKDDLDAENRREFRAKATAVGDRLGFETTPDGLWRSPSGLSILTRTVDRPLSLAAATHFVEEIAARRDTIGGAGSTVLFVVEGQQSADVFKVAIRQRHCYDVMRVITLQNLDALQAMLQAGTLDHAKVLVLLTPAANIDVGEILSVVRATGIPASSTPEPL